jgi:hypothetical protein
MRPINDNNDQNKKSFFYFQCRSIFLANNMSRTTTAISDGIELQGPITHSHTTTSKAASPRSIDDLNDNFTPAEPLNIVEASLIADSNVPEGGYGWVVIAGCAVLTWWYLGMSYSWGIMQTALVERGLSTAYTLSFIGSLCVTFNSILALAHARFIRLVGTRQAALIGVTCLGGGTVLSGFCTENVGGLFFTSGVLTGLGTRCVGCVLYVSLVDADIVQLVFVSCSCRSFLLSISTRNVVWLLD